MTTSRNLANVGPISTSLATQSFVNTAVAPQNFFVTGNWTNLYVWGKAANYLFNSATPVTFTQNVAPTSGGSVSIVQTGSGAVTFAVAAAVTTAGWTIQGQTVTQGQNTGITVVADQNTKVLWCLPFASGVSDKVTVSANNADSIVTTTDGTSTWNVYKYTTQGMKSITFGSSGLVDVLCVGASGRNWGFGNGGGGGYVLQNGVYVTKNFAYDVFVGGRTQFASYQGCGDSSFFNGIIACGGGDGNGYTDRAPSAGASGGGGRFTSGSMYQQGAIVVSAGLTRGGYGNAGGTGGGAGFDADSGGAGVTTNFGLASGTEVLGSQGSDITGRVYIRVKVS